MCVLVRPTTYIGATYHSPHKPAVSNKPITPKMVPTTNRHADNPATNNTFVTFLSVVVRVCACKLLSQSQVKHKRRRTERAWHNPQIEVGQHRIYVSILVLSGGKYRFLSCPAFVLFERNVPLLCSFKKQPKCNVKSILNTFYFFSLK